MTGTELEIVTPAAPETLGPGIGLALALHTNARTDRELLEVWLNTHRDGSPHTVRAYARVGTRYIDAIATRGAGVRTATLEDVQAALEGMREQADGSPATAATTMTYVAAVKSFLGFAHRIGFTRFNAAPLIKLKKAPRQIAQRLLDEVDVRMLIRAAHAGRDRIMLELAYYGGLRISELVNLTWSQVIPRDSGEVQLEIVGKGYKVRQVLIPAEIGKGLLTSRGEAPPSAPVSRRRAVTASRSQNARLRTWSRPRPDGPASIRELPHIGFAMRTLRMLSTTARPSRWCRRRSAMPT